MPIEDVIRFAVLIPGSVFVVLLFLLLVAAHFCDPGGGDKDRAPF